MIERCGVSVVRQNQKVEKVDLLQPPSVGGGQPVEVER